MKIQYTHIHPIYGKLKFIRMSASQGMAFFTDKNELQLGLTISEVEVYKPNNLTNIPYVSPEPTYSGTY